MQTAMAYLRAYLRLSLWIALLSTPWGWGIEAQAAEPAAADPDRILRLLNDLDDDHFDVRQRADQQLRAMGPGILPWLHDEYQRNPSLEVRDRVRRMIRDLHKQQQQLGDHSRMR